MFFKKWRERIETEILSKISRLDSINIKFWNEQIAEIKENITREKVEWDQFISEQRSGIVSHNMQIERGLRMCEESLEIIKKLLEDRK